MRSFHFAFALALIGSFAAGAPAQQYPMLDRVAAKVVQKYQTSSCQQLATERGQPPTGERAAMEQRIVVASDKESKRPPDGPTMHHCTIDPGWSDA